MNRKRFVLLTVTAGIVLLALGGWFFFSPHNPEATPEDGRKVLYWHDPMVPGYKSDKPGKSPFMDMELVPVYDDEQGRSSVAGGRTPGATEESGAGGPPAVTVRPEVTQRLGVRTTAVVRALPTRRLTAPGYLFRQDGRLVAIADVFGHDTAWLKPGMAAEAIVAEVPGQRFPAVLERVESDRDIGGRSVKVRVRLLKHDGRLRANMAAEVLLSAPGTSHALLVPREAVIRTGQRTALIRVLDDGRFQPVEVVAGEEFGELVEIKSGVKEGEKIVVSGQFLIDSEASVRESFQRMESPAPAAEPKR